jgi:MYXO-CTERM domain-containing protein
LGARGALKAALTAALLVGSMACAPGEPPPVETRLGALSPPDVTGPGNLDVLFVIDNAPGMAPMQAKLADQVPNFISVLGGLDTGLPNIHVAVISSDMGAPGGSADEIGCTQAGDQGQFQAQPRGSCTDSTLKAGATFVSNSWGDINYTAPNIAEVIQCIVPLGEGGCRFGHPLAAIARALGADGMPAPAANAGFLRADAMLAIFMLTNQDDCSASSPVTGLYSLNSGPDAQHPGLGPLTTYRCNEFGHLCRDPAGADPNALDPAPESPPPDAQGTPSAPTLDLADCASNETGGLLTPVQTFVDEIRALKSDPDHQIVVSAILAPATPYTVAWVPAADPQAAPGQLWPQVEHSCGAMGAAGTNPEATELTTDGSFGDPAIRLTQFVSAVGPNSVIASVCNASYSRILAPVAILIAPDPPPTWIASDAGPGGAPDGSAAPGDGGPHPDDGGVSTDRVPGPIGLRLDGCGCSVGAPAPAGSALALLLIFPAMVRRRARAGRKN